MYFSLPIRAIIDQNLDMTPVICFSVLNIFRNVFTNQCTLCNETEKTKHVIEKENKHNLNSKEELLMFHFLQLPSLALPMLLCALGLLGSPRVMLPFPAGCYGCVDDSFMVHNTQVLPL